jgi:short-subunit dehydrogenase
MGRVDLRDRPIIITGASSGIGRATALCCAEAGMPVVLAARRVERLEQVRDEIERAGGQAIAERCDVTVQDDCDRLAHRCVEAFGELYAVFANAGYGVELAAHTTSDKQLRDLFEVNFFGTMNTLRPIVGRLVEQQRGHVVICSSSIAKLGIPYFGAYCATKAAQTMIGQAMQVELRRVGVAVSTLHPIGTRTEFFDVAKTHSNTGGESLDSHAPAWTKQSPDTVARSIVRCLKRGSGREIWPTFAGFIRVGIAIANAFPVLGALGTKDIADAGRKAQPGATDPKSQNIAPLAGVTPPHDA